MKRKALGFDPTDGEFIRSENHNRLLSSFDWKGLQAPNAVKDVVSSDVDREVCSLANGAAPYIINSTFDRFSGLLSPPNSFIQKVLKRTKKASPSIINLVFII
jgi:hypothetical protein